MASMTRCLRSGDCLPKTASPSFPSTVESCSRQRCKVRATRPRPQDVWHTPIQAVKTDRDAIYEGLGVSETPRSQEPRVSGKTVPFDAYVPGAVTIARLGQ